MIDLMVELVVVEALAAAEADYTADMAAIRDGLRLAAIRRRVEAEREALARQAADKVARKAGWEAELERQRRGGGPVAGTPVPVEPWVVPVYEPFREVVYTPAPSWAPGPDWEGWAQPPAARVPKRRRRRRRAPVSTAGLVVRLVLGGTAAYLFVGGLLLSVLR